MHSARRKLLSSAIIGLGLLVQAGASAEELVLEEIIVTAQKRDQSLKDTPMTVNVVSGQQVREFAAFSFQDLSKMTAGLVVTGTDFETDIATRGVGTNLNGAVSPRVPVYLDGALISQQRGLFSGLYDLQQMELLRGPQGTLYGLSSPAGAITVRSRDPDLERIDGYVQQSFTDKNGSNTQLAASLPLLDGKLGIRVAGLYDDNRNSAIRNVTLDEDLETETEAFRIVALWRPNEDWSVRLAYHDIHDEIDNDPPVRGNGYDVEDRVAMADYESSYTNDSELTIAEINYTFANEWTATLLGSHQNNIVKRYFDQDGSQVQGQEQYVVSDVPDSVNAEFRLASSGNERWDWTAGAFYQDSESETPVFADTYVARPGLRIFVATTGPAYNDGQSKGLFTHNTIQVGENGTVTAGLRYNTTKRTNRQDFTLNYFLLLPNNVRLPVGGATQAGVAPEFQEDDDSAWTGTLKYQHRLNEEMMVYATYDRGWRAGTANISGRAQPPVFGVFDPEESDNLEIGLKWEFLQGRGLMNVAAYYQLYENFQYQAEGVAYRQPDGSTALAAPVVNVDEAESWGVDADLTVLLSERWTLRATLAYNKAELTDAEDIPCTTGDPLSATVWDFNTCDLGGERAGEQPEWSANLMSEYAWPVNSGGMELYLRGLLITESEYYSISESADLDGYTSADLFLGLRGAERGWDANLWVKNVTDEAAELRSLTLPPVPDYTTGGEVPSGFVNITRQLPPRTAGITLSYNF